jgi:hypothetical protein
MNYEHELLKSNPADVKTKKVVGKAVTVNWRATKFAFEDGASGISAYSASPRFTRFCSFVGYKVAGDATNTLTFKSHGLDTD